jgi:DNA-binding CsgD family transcriptional regulator
MNDLQSYVGRIIGAQSTQQAFETFCAAMGDRGYDRITYSLVNDHPSLRLPSQHGLATSYPEDWMKYYARQNYAQVDPVTARVLSSRIPFFWSDVTAKHDRLSPPHRMMDEAADAGLGEGIGISLRGQGAELVGVGIARASSAFGQNRKQDYSFLGSAAFLSTCLHETFRDLTINSARAAFTHREHDVLSWAAEGKSDDEIGCILNITRNTVRYHWKNAARKLGVTGRNHALIKAFRQQIIEPARIRTSYQKW